MPHDRPPDETTPDGRARTASHVMVGYSRMVVQELHRSLPAGSVVVVEDPHVIAARDVAAELRPFEVVGALVPAPSQDERAARELVDHVPRPAALRVVFPGTEYGVVGAAALAESWAVPGATVRAAEILRDKRRLREVAGRAGVAQPAWADATSVDVVTSFRAAHDGHCVLKPANRQASLGVQRIGPDDDLELAWRHTTRADEPRIRARGLDDARYLVESTLHGDEVSVEALVRDGRLTFVNVTDKEVRGGRYPVEAGHTVPSTQPAHVWRALTDSTEALVDALGYRDGILHGEWILVEGVPHLVECAGRMPGDDIHALIGHAYATDLIADYLATMDAGAPDVPTRSAERAAAIRFLFAPPGIVSAITSPHGDSDFDRLTITAHPGDTVGDAASSWSRLGSATLHGSDPATVTRVLRERVDAIIICTS